MEYKNRVLENTIKDFIGEYPILMITGPRQVGKKTLLHHLTNTTKQKINFVSLGDMLLRTQANEDPELFLRNYETPLVIDEFQYAPKLLSYLKITVDEARKNALFGNKKEVGTLYYLTGSQVFQTMKNVSESLAGRVGIFDLFAFSNRELENLEEEAFIPNISELKKKTPQKRLSTTKIFERIIKGSYPEVYNDTNIPVEHYYSSYIRTYIERDIREIINVKDENKFVKFLSSIAARTGQEWNASKVGSEIGIDNKTVEEWLSILKNTGILYLLQPYANNNVKKAIKRPKIYFMDTGLACYLTGYNDAKVLEKTTYSGAIFETFIVSEIIKTFTNKGMDPRKHIYFYRDSNQKEIDLLILYNNKVYPIEIKKSSNPGQEAIKNFEVVKKFNMEIENGIVLCLTKEIMAIDDHNYYVPIEYI